MKETFILFDVAGATYGVRTHQIQWVEMVEAITRVPNAPDFVEGLTAVRGKIIPVVSMRRRFHMEIIQTSIRSRVLIIRLDNRLIGMLVDSARQFVEIDQDQIKPAPETLTGSIVPYLDGVAMLTNQMVLIMNLQRLFNEGEREALAESALEEKKKLSAR